MHSSVIYVGACIFLFGLPVITLGDTVKFPLEDYANLGDVRNAVSPIYQQIMLADETVPSDLQAVSNLFSTVNSYAGTVLSTPDKITMQSFTKGMADLLSKASNINGNTDLQGLANLVSHLDLSPLGNDLSAEQLKINALSNQLSGSLAPSTYFDHLNYAVAVSSSARDAALSLQNDAQYGYQNLLDIYADLPATASSLQNYSTAIGATAQATQAVLDKFLQLSSESAADALVLEPAEDILSGNLSAISLLQQQANATLAKFNDLTPPMENRLDDLRSLITLVNNGLDQPPYPSSWTTDGYSTTGPSALYEVSFDGTHFDYPYTEIDTPFLLGTLSITNFITPGIGAAAEDFSMTFNVARDVSDPVLGVVTTYGTADLAMHYVATPNTDDPVESADYFFVPALGIYVNIYETATFVVDVYGSYHSPLRIVDIEPDPSSSGGFITTATPEPRSAFIVGLGLVSLLFLRRSAVFCSKWDRC